LTSTSRLAAAIAAMIRLSMRSPGVNAVSMLPVAAKRAAAG